MRRPVAGDLLKEATVVLPLSRVVTEVATHHRAVMAVLLLLSKAATANKVLVVMANSNRAGTVASSRADTDDLLLSKVAIQDNNRAAMVHLHHLLDIRLAIPQIHDT
jgi:hypothetical protein